MSGVDVIRRLVGLMGSAGLRCRAAIAACFGLEGLGIVLAIIGPYLLKVLVDQFGDTTVYGLLTDVALFVIAWTAPTILGPCRNLFSSRINTRLAGKLSVDTMGAVLNEGLWRTADSGRVQGLLERLPYSLAIVIDGLIWRTAPLIIQLAFSLVVIVRIMSWAYVAGFVALAFGFVVVSWYGVGRQVSVSRAYNDRLATSGELLGDILKNARRVVANRTAFHEMTSVGKSFEQREQAEADMNGSLVRLSALQWLVMAASLFAIMAMAGFDVMQGRISSGDFVLVQAYAIRLVLPLSTVGFVLSQSTAALAAIGDILDMQGGTTSPAIDHPPASNPVAICVKDLSFSYGPNLGGLTGINLVFPAASFTAIVGGNGSGKSTLAQLIAGLLKPKAGHVIIGSRTMAEVSDEEEIARQVLYVPQRTSLFNRELRANLLYPPCHHDEALALEILKSWGFQDESRPIDPALKVGEGGSALSGGQAQKLELARLMGIRRSCLVLDESTSALDPHSEARVITDLRNAVGLNTTLIFVTHSVSIAQDADQVIWLRDGQVAGVDEHQELWKLPAYRKLWNADIAAAARSD